MSVLTDVSPAVQGQAAECGQSEAGIGDAILAQARTLAAELDPQRAALYHRMAPARWLQAVDLGLELLTAHAAYRLHHPRGRGRRRHAAEMHAALDAANASNLVAAVALVLVLGRILDRSPRGT